MRPSACPVRHSAGAVRTGLLSAGLLGAVALLAACGPKTQGTGGSASAPPSVSPAASTSAAAASPNPAASTSAAVTGCATSALKVAVNTAKPGAAAGSIYYPVDFTNTSASTCTLFGYPGVSFVTGPSGTLMGRAATRNPVKPAATVTLAPGQVAHATLQVAAAGNYSPAQCKPVTAHWLRVYPPNQTAALDVPFSTQACSARLPHGVGSQLSTSVVQPGAS